MRRNRLKWYLFIQQYSQEFGVRWLLRKFNLCPNAYYNFLKNRKAQYNKNKGIVKAEIKQIYHANNAIPGYRTMQYYLANKGYIVSAVTVHKYMNKELGLCSIVRKKKLQFQRTQPYKTFENLINQNFHADKINRKWVTDFTYVHLQNGSLRYNCTIIDLHDRSVVASLTGRNITSELAKQTLQKALESQKSIDTKKLILHSDRGSQFTSKYFTEYCTSLGIKQSMSAPGYPYDNAPMERYFNTLKNELIYHHSYKTEEELYNAIECFAYVKYNHARPHAFNNYKTPFEARYTL